VLPVMRSRGGVATEPGLSAAAWRAGAGRWRAVVLATVLAACNRPDAGDAPPGAASAVASVAGEDLFGGLTWRLVSQRDAHGDMQQAEGRVALRFLDGRLTGSTGCNQLDASYALDGRRASRLTIETGSLTVRACTPSLHEQEQLLLANLEQSAVVRVAAQTLVLRDAQGIERLVFEAEQSLTLPGVRWRLVQVDNGTGGLQSVPDDLTLTLTLADDGALTITTPCHDFTAVADREADALVITAVRPVATRACAPEHEWHEGRLRAALGATVRYAIEEERLSLRRESGMVAARFVAAR
jgi:heat shock protein HslJ